MSRRQVPPSFETSDIIGRDEMREMVKKKEILPLSGARSEKEKISKLLTYFTLPELKVIAELNLHIGNRLYMSHLRKDEMISLISRSNLTPLDILKSASYSQVRGILDKMHINCGLQEGKTRCINLIISSL